MKLEVPRAALHWERTGVGPVLLMLQGGDGDAKGSAPIAAHLPGFNVISYDRRGLSRSSVDVPAAIELGTHTRDALAVLEAATPEPAFVFGTSIGALIGLDLVARWPNRVRRLIAHEPPCTELLAPELRAQVERGREDIETTFRTQGVMPAMRKFFAATGIDPTDREPDAPLPAFDPQRLRNLEFFLQHDAPAARRFQLDLSALKAAASRVVVAAGERTGGHWLYDCSTALAHALGLPLQTFPGGHGGYVARPRGFGEAITRLCT
jgi:pimeloyl-ACP methyl ester carboxylesterase